MKKIKASSLLALLVIGFCLCAVTVGAATVTEAKYENGRITVSGTGNAQVQIVLFGPDKAPVYMMTADVADGKFSAVLPAIEGLTKGEYTVKVADYDGGNAAAASVKGTGGKEPSAPTGDAAYLFILPAAAAFAALTLAVIGKKRAEGGAR